MQPRSGLTHLPDTFFCSMPLTSARTVCAQFVEKGASAGEVAVIGAEPVCLCSARVVTRVLLHPRSYCSFVPLVLSHPHPAWIPAPEALQIDPSAASGLELLLHWR